MTILYNIYSIQYSSVPEFPHLYTVVSVYKKKVIEIQRAIVRE
jgi:hypothetical protein